VLFESSGAGLGVDSKSDVVVEVVEKRAWNSEVEVVVEVVEKKEVEDDVEVEEEEEEESVLSLARSNATCQVFRRKAA
jgi:predicted CopG family antitoxin